MSRASSPCIGLCTLDASRALCLGCGRSLAEIAAWSGLAEPERRRIMATLPRRLAGFEARPAPVVLDDALDAGFATS